MSYSTKPGKPVIKHCFKKNAFHMSKLQGKKKGWKRAGGGGEGGLNLNFLPIP